MHSKLFIKLMYDDIKRKMAMAEEEEKKEANEREAIKEAQNLEGECSKSGEQAVSSAAGGGGPKYRLMRINGNKCWMRLKEQKDTGTSSLSETSLEMKEQVPPVPTCSRKVASVPTASPAINGAAADPVSKTPSIVQNTYSRIMASNGWSESAPKLGERPRKRMGSVALGSIRNPWEDAKKANLEQDGQKKCGGSKQGNASKLEQGTSPAGGLTRPKNEVKVRRSALVLQRRPSFDQPKKSVSWEEDSSLVEESPITPDESEKAEEDAKEKERKKAVLERAKLASKLFGGSPATRFKGRRK